MAACTANDTLPMPAARAAPRAGDQLVLWIKWIASIAQILGYGATAFGATPLNLYCFLMGLVGWFAVGVFWRDRAIMLIHVVALAAMILGMLTAA